MGFDQKTAIDYGMDMVDLTILRWFIDFQFTGKMARREHEGKEFYWVNYEYLLQDIPIIEIKNTDSLYRRMAKIKIFEHHTFRNAHGTFSCFRIIPELYSRLLETPNDLKVEQKESKTTHESEAADPKVGELTDSKVGPKDPSTNFNPSTNDPSTKYIYSENKNVFLHPEEYEKLVQKYGLDKTTEMITYLANYKLSSGRKYKSDYGAINQWVVDWYEKKYSGKESKKQYKNLEDDFEKQYQKMYGNEKITINTEVVR